MNGATCQVTGTGSTYSCTCPAGYSGTNCQNCKILSLKLTKPFNKRLFSFLFKLMHAIIILV